MRETEHRDSILKKLAHNVFWLFLQLGLTRLSSFIIIIILARRLTQAAYGQFSYTVSLIGMFIVVSDMGLTALLTREASRTRAKTSEIFTRTVLVKTPLMAASFVLFTVFALVTARAEAASYIILAAAFFTESLARFASAPFNANEKMHMLLLGDAVHKGVLLSLLWAVLRVSPQLVAVGLAYFAAALFLLLYYAAAFQRTFGLTSRALSPLGAGDSFIATLSASAPMALSGLIMAAYVNTDIIMIKWFKGAAATGLYAVCYSFYLGIGVISSFIVQAIVPRLSSTIEDRASDQTNFILRGTVKLLCLCSLPLAVGGAFLARDILSFFYGGAYAHAEAAFRIFMYTAPVNFLNLLFSYYMFSARRQGELNKIYFASLALNIVLNALLIPLYGISGAAAATLAAEALFMGVFISRHTEFLALFESYWAVRLALALSALALYAAAVPHNVNLLVRILFGALLYGGVLAVTGALAGEKRLLRLVFRKGNIDAEKNIAG